ncbi:Uncharacterised protein [Mycobacteroides abscessus subsp. abscessus]|nr:Uncharacterised protein [Mycobacteroides abscessus subsp. abscessus]
MSAAPESTIICLYSGAALASSVAMNAEPM